MRNADKDIHFEDIFLNLLQKAKNTLERFLNTKNWKFRLLIVSILISLFNSLPSYSVLLDGEFDKHFLILEQQSNSPLTSLNINDESNHASKLTFRLLPPLITKPFGGKKLPYLILIHFSFFGLIFSAIYLAYKTTKDKLLTASFIFLFSLIPIGAILCSDYRGIFDALAFFLITLSLIYYNKPIVLFVALFSSFFTDERALISSGLIISYMIIKQNLNLRTSIANKSIITVLATTILYLITRLCLSSYFGLTIGKEGMLYFFDQINNIPIGLFTLFEFSWILVFLLFYFLYRDLKLFQLIFLFLSFALVLVVGFSVMDITRSLCYSFPILFISLEVLYKKIKIEKLYYLFLICAALNLFPTYFAESKNAINWAYPLPLQLIYNIKELILS